MSNIPVDVAQLVALFMESIFYGLYLVTFGMCMYIMLVRGRSGARQRGVFIAVAVSMFVVATLDVVLLLVHILYAFVWYHGPGSAIGEFLDISVWINAIRLVTYSAQTSIGDVILIYRCFVVYGRSLLVLIPFGLLWIAELVTEVFDCYIEFTLHKSTLFTANQLTPFILSLECITLALNVIATSLIIYKIWRVDRSSRRLFSLRSSDSLKRAIRIVVESGLMYTLSVVCLMGVYISGNNAMYGVSDCLVQIIGISFNLIIIRIDQGQTLETEYSLDSFPAEQGRGSAARMQVPRLIFSDGSSHDASTVRSTVDDQSVQMGSAKRVPSFGYERAGDAGDACDVSRTSVIGFVSAA
ncbi:hypothetical protein PHLGIDRAFT_412628 [Phlebiopsis gigantea 11061_1 CR5-6]|uniref:G-protein coupled receptors family 1 profile domain-containing protein n=1 Tax=Phlebiopsis gigantea (strain 11061_1 CR5-6) TaxID=745531 RepID=A0A0C3NQX7_PHLG1|nr:hypothetical protein PHLGIDRAFT_412628 [Phlebiopsis gigantea 11061_1 CR5-6]